MGWKSQLLEPLAWLAGAVAGKGVDPRVVAPRNILVLRPSDLGDLLTTTPIFEALRRRFPVTRIVAGVGSWGFPILEHNPFVDEIAAIDLPWANKFVRDRSPRALLGFLASSPQIAQLRQHRGFDVGIDVTGSLVGVLTLLRLGARHRVGLHGYRGGSAACQHAVDWTDCTHVAGTALRQAEMLGAEALPEARPQIYLVDRERDAAEQIWGLRQPGNPPRFLVSCGGGLEDKCWTAEALGHALRDVAAAMRAEWGASDLLLIGGPADRGRAARVLAAGVPGLRSVCGETSLRITFALTERADLVLTNASMMLHVAAAFRKPTIAVLGGMHSDRQSHDRLWGYPPPYESIGPATPSGWPSCEVVVEAVMTAATARPGRRADHNELQA